MSTRRLKSDPMGVLRHGDLVWIANDNTVGIVLGYHVEKKEHKGDPEWSFVRFAVLWCMSGHLTRNAEYKRYNKDTQLLRSAR